MKYISTILLTLLTLATASGATRTDALIDPTNGGRYKVPIKSRACSPFTLATLDDLLAADGNGIYTGSGSLVLDTVICGAGNDLTFTSPAGAFLMCSNTMDITVCGDLSMTGKVLADGWTTALCGEYLDKCGEYSDPLIAGAGNCLDLTLGDNCGATLLAIKDLAGCVVASVNSNGGFSGTGEGLQDLQVTNLQLGTAGNIIYFNACGAPNLLATGTTGQVLTATTGAPVSWVAAGGVATYLHVPATSFITSGTANGDYANFIDAVDNGVADNGGTSGLYAIVGIPEGKKATHVDLYSNQNRTIEAWTLTLSTGAKVSSGSGTSNTQLDLIPDISASSGTVVLIEYIPLATGNRIRGAVLTLADI